MAGNGINAARQMNGKLPPVQQKVTSDINSVDFEPESVIGEGVDIRGTLEFERLLRIDGRFEGILRSKGDLIIGAKGQLVGDVNGIQNLVIDGGSIKGSVVVERMVMIGKATIRGNITCKSLKAGIDATIIGMVNINPSAPEMIGLNGEVLSVLPEVQNQRSNLTVYVIFDKMFVLLSF
jgi:cytoskeletal protein CcmA (bactofilin family)